MSTLRYWQDDDRKSDYITYYHDKEEEYVPVYKILKEMYDEDKANLYIYDSEEEYRYKYSECYFRNYVRYSYYHNELTSTQSDDLVVLDDNVESEVDDETNEVIGVETTPISNIEKDVKEYEEESTFASNKFIYT